jgi:hypothetical protein
MREPAKQLRQREAEDQAVESDEVRECVQCRSPRALVHACCGKRGLMSREGECRPARERAA